MVIVAIPQQENAPKIHFHVNEIGFQFVLSAINRKLGSMKTALALSSLLFLIVLNSGCSQSTTEIVTTDEPAPVVEEVEDEESEKFKPTKNMVQFDAYIGSVTVKVGQQVYGSEEVHGSVGYAATATSSDKSGLVLSDNIIEYHKPQKPGMTGGDAATEYFVFDALKAGTYEITVVRNYRGDLEREYSITVTVEAAE